MRLEEELILLTCLNEKTEEEKNRMEEIIVEELDWGYIIGQLIHHRLTGYFIKGLSEDCYRFIFREVKKQFELIVKLNKVITTETMKFMQQVFDEFDKKCIKYAGLKGVVYNASLYEMGIRRSNDIDILIPESELSVVDRVLREKGFIQSLSSGYGEATKKEKLIQRLHHHDLVPYYKKNGDSILLPYFKVDINFKIDNGKEGLTEQVIEAGTQIYETNGFRVRGLRWETHLLHLNIHFCREASHSIWVSDKRDCMLYKLVDIENTIRYIGREKLVYWVDFIKKFNCNKDVFFTFYYLNKLYPNGIYENVIKDTKIEDEGIINKIEILGTQEIVKREKSFMESMFDLKYCRDFSKEDYKNVNV